MIRTSMPVEHPENVGVVYFILINQVGVFHFRTPAFGLLKNLKLVEIITGNTHGHVMKPGGKTNGVNPHELYYMIE